MLVVHSNIRVSAYTDKVVVVSPQEGEDLLAEFPPRLRAGWPAILAEVHTRGMLDISLFTPSRDASGNPIVARAAWKYANLEPMLTGEGGMTSAFAMHDSGKFAITVFPDIKAIMAAAPAHVSKSAQAEAMQGERAIYLVAWQTKPGYLRTSLLRGRQGVTFKDARIDKLDELVALLNVTWPVVGNPEAIVYSDAAPEDGDGRMIVLASDDGTERRLTIGYAAQWIS